MTNRFADERHRGEHGPMRLQPYGTPTKELAMGEKPGTIREAVGVFGSANDLQAAIDDS